MPKLGKQRVAQLAQDLRATAEADAVIVIRGENIVWSTDPKANAQRVQKHLNDVAEQIEYEIGNKVNASQDEYDGRAF